MFSCFIFLRPGKRNPFTETEIAMSQANQSPMSMRGRVIAAVLAAAAAIVLMLTIQASAAQAACTGGSACVWRGTFFSGEELNFSCAFETFTTLELNSAKDNCGVNVRIGWTEGGSTNWKACMNPGGERPNPGRFNTTKPNGC
jgi:hypothetical protein